MRFFANYSKNSIIDTHTPTTLWWKVCVFLFSLGGIGMFVLSVLFVTRPLHASGPSSNQVLNYQARLTDNNGIPLADGAKNVKFTIYDALTAGNCEYSVRGTCGTPTAKSVTVANGHFSTLFGEAGDVAMPAGLFSGDESRFLEVQVETSTPGTYETLSPRKRIVSGPFAMNANLLDDLDTSAIGGAVAFVPVTDSSGNLTLTKNVTVDSTTFFVDATNDRVGIGTVSPVQKLSVGGGTNDQIYLDANGTGGGYKLYSFGTAIGSLDAPVGSFNIAAYSSKDLTFQTESIERLRITAANGFIGIGTISPATVLDISGALSVREMAAPTVSPTDQGRIYFDSTSNKFRVSENGGAYADLVGGGGASGWTDDGTAVRLTTITDSVGIGTVSPGAKLDIANGAISNGIPLNISLASATTTVGNDSSSIRIINTDTTNNNYEYINFGTVDSGATTLATAGLGAVNTVHTAGSVSGDLFFTTRSSGTYAERMRILANGNVGIGTTNPITDLHISRSTGYPLRLERLNSGISQDAAYEFRITSDPVGSGDLYTPGSLALVGQTASTDFSIRAGNSGNPQFTLLDTGNVGIGTTNPGYPLEVRKGQNASTYVTVKNDTAGTASLAGFYALRDGTAGINMSAYSASYTTNGMILPNAGIISTDSGISNGIILIASGASAPITFGTGGFAAANERMRITSGGNVGIGTTSPDTVLDINGALSVREMAAPALSPADQGRIYFDSTTNTFKVSQNGGAYTDLVSGASSGWTDDGTVVRLTTSTDSVGIGTTSPAALLHVATAVHGIAISHDTIRARCGTGCADVNGGGLTLAGSFSSDGGTVYLGGSSRGDANVNAIILQQNGTVRLKVEDGGNVGIGTTDPGYKLDVQTTAVTPLNVESSNVDATAIRLANTSTGGRAWSIGSAGQTSAVSLPVGAFHLYDYTAGAVRLMIGTNGNVGIGTTTPTGKLVVRSAGGNNLDGLLLQTENTNDTWSLFETGGHDLSFGYATNASGADANGDFSTKVTFSDDGFVGIGVAPTVPLHVSGSGAFAIASISPNQTLAAGNASWFVTSNDTQAADKGGSIALGGYYVGTSAQVPFGYVAGRKENGTSSNEDGYLQFGTRLTGSGGVERMRITSVGNVGIGTTAPGTELDVWGIAAGTSVIRAFDMTSATTGTGGTINLGGYSNGTSTAVNYTQLVGAKENASAGNTAGYFAILTPVDAGPFVEKMRVSSAGNVGIGTTNPQQLLEVGSTTHNRIRLNSTLASASQGLEITESGTARAYIQRQEGNKLSFYVGDGTTQDMVILDGGNVGIGTTTPGARLTVSPTINTVSGTNTTVAVSPVLTLTGASTLTSLDMNPVIDGSSAVTLYRGIFVRPDFTVTSASSATVVGVEANPRIGSTGTYTDLYGLVANPDVASTATVGSVYGVQIDNNVVGTGVANNYGLYVTNTTGGTNNWAIYTAGGLIYHERSAGTVAAFNRTTDDGTIISLQQAGTEEGTISVAGTTVSYNAFTGSHYAWTDEVIQMGTLVTLTGDNKRLHGSEASEILYGIAPTSTKNDSKVMGAYLALQEPNRPGDLDNPQLIMAVGNGEMWVSEEGGNIEAGDYLISSSTSGHAMKDDATSATSYIVARAAEAIDWATVTEMVGGVKHKKISIFFESFTRKNENLALTETEDLQTLTADLNVNGKLLLNVRGIIGLQWSISEEGKLVVNEIETKKVTAEEVVVKTTDAKQTIGTGTIPANADFVRVDNSIITPDTNVFATFKTDPGSSWWIAETGTGYFIVKTKQPVAAEAKFNYWLIGVDDQTSPPVEQLVVIAPPSEQVVPEPEVEPPTDQELGSSEE